MLAWKLPSGATWASLNCVKTAFFLLSKTTTTKNPHGSLCGQDLQSLSPGSSYFFGHDLPFSPGPSVFIILHVIITPRHGCLLIRVKPLDAFSQIMVIKTIGTLVTPQLLSPHTYWSLNSTLSFTHSPYTLVLTLVMSFLKNLNWNSWSPPSLHVLGHHVPRYPYSM